MGVVVINIVKINKLLSKIKRKKKKLVTKHMDMVPFSKDYRGAGRMHDDDDGPLHGHLYIYIYVSIN